MSLRDMFFPKKRDFFGMMLAHARKTVEGMDALHAFIQDPVPEKGQRVDDLEHEADDLRRHLIRELNQSFVTPIDREDIQTLSRAVDDMVDYAKTTVEEIRLFRIKPNQHITKMTEALANSARDVCRAIEVMPTRPLEAHELATRAKKAENFVEHRYREGLAELFETNDALNALKYREVYRHLSNAADRGDKAAEVIQDIVVKIT